MIQVVSFDDDQTCSPIGVMKEIDSLDIFRIANRNPSLRLHLWLKLVGAEIRHPSFGDGRITSIEDTTDRGPYIHIKFDIGDVKVFDSRIFLNGLLQTLHVSDELYSWLQDERLQQPYNRSNGLKEIEIPYYNISILDWFLKNYQTANDNIFNNGAVTTGTGSFEESEFDQFLISKGMDVYKSGDFEIMVVGRQNCDVKIMEDQLDIRRSNGIKIYSQEMVIAYFLTGNDPYQDDNILYGFGKGHPTINYLASSGFRWPKSEIFTGLGNNKINTDIMQDDGLLKYLGYKTGKRGEEKLRRQEILREVYTMQLHRVQLPREYLREWGRPETGERLLKLANVIATLARNAKRRPNPPRFAIRDWEGDLEWLKENYYNGVYRFIWPDTYY